MGGAQPILFDDGFRVGEFAVYPKRLALVKDGATVRLEPKVMAVLVHLAQRAGEVVTRNEFADEVWRGRIVSDEVLSRDISILRSQLGDNVKDPTYVLTIPRVGYRLVAPVKPLVEQSADPPLAATAPLEPVADGAVIETPVVAAALPSPRMSVWRGRRWMLFAGLAAVLAIVAAVVPRPPTMQTLDPTNIAVLPFVSLSETKDDEYFGDGLSEEIMHSLAGADGIKVVARTSSFAFRDGAEDIRSIGRHLNAGSLLEGSVRRDGNRLRVTAQLIDANTGLHTWSESYDRRLSDIFDVQNEISTAIANRLVGTLAPDARLTEVPTRDIEAYQMFLRANHLLRRRGATHLERAVNLFQETIARDPDFGRAYAGLAEAYTLQPSYAGTSEKNAHALALAAAERAEALGQGTGRARGVRAFLHFRSREWRAAKTDFEAAVAANPSDADLQQWYSQYLANVGWIERSAQAADAAVATDPLSPVVNQRAGVVQLWLGHPDVAARYFDIAEELGIQGPGLPEAYVAFLLRQGRIAEARKWLLETQALRGQSSSWIDPSLAAIDKSGTTASALVALGTAFHAGELGVRMYVGALFFIGDIDGLYTAMEDIVASGEPFDVELFFSADGRRLRADDRFLPLMNDLGLVAFWEAEGLPDACTRDAAARITCG